MKKIFLIIMAALMLTSCGVVEKGKEIIERKLDSFNVEKKEIKFVDVNGKELLNSSHIKDATAQYGETSEMGLAQYYIQLEFTEEGKALFYKATAENIGKSILIMVEDEVISAPVVSEAINDEYCIITGEFDKEDAYELARAISAGARN